MQTDFEFLVCVSVSLESFTLGSAVLRREKMRKYMLVMILSLLCCAFIFSTPSRAALPAVTILEQADQIRESPNSEQTSEQDTEPQPEPGPSQGARPLPVRE